MIGKFWLGKLDVLINDGANWTVSDDISELIIDPDKNNRTNIIREKDGIKFSALLTCFLLVPLREPH